MAEPSITVFGIRHHGPGCARSLREALEALQPDSVLVEGPPEAQEAIPLIAHPDMRPPVALLIYPPDQPQRAAFYPFTIFSPEWQALRFAVERGIPAHFMDLPQSVMLARRAHEAETPGDRSLEGGDAELPASAGVAPDRAANDGGAAYLHDPIAAIAEAAGYGDHELWWEHQIEQRRDASGLFEAILELMGALREQAPQSSTEEAQREAAMRQAIRGALKEGYQRIAVVCGAWHAPALTTRGLPKSDAALLAGIRRTAVQATWIPWTNARLSLRGGYGAGIISPGWYEHLWTAPHAVASGWIARAAHLLRAQDLDASPAGVIDAVRLAETLAAMRDLPGPGLAELHEAILTVLCHGDAAPMALIRDRLEIGETLGGVPDATPALPLQRDLAAEQRRLRLPPSAEVRALDLDLRKDTDRGRSHLLHRLLLLGIAWGTAHPVTGKSGTFHEYWQIQWRPEMAVGLIEANVWGNTVAAAASTIARHRAQQSRDLPDLTALLDAAMLAGLSHTTEFILGCIGGAAALAADVRLLMDAMPPLARVARYGDVRGTRPEQVLPILAGLFERVVVALPAACASLDDDAAASMISSIDAVQAAIALLDREEQRHAWQLVLAALSERETAHAMVRGRCCRLRLEARAMDADDLQRHAGLALSPAVPAAQAAAWIEGLLRGSGMLLLHQEGIWRTLDRWLCGLDTRGFTDILPLLRRAFSGFQPAERRAMGERVKTLTSDARRERDGRAPDSTPVDRERAATVLPVLGRILGVSVQREDTFQPFGRAMGEATDDHR